MANIAPDSVASNKSYNSLKDLHTTFGFVIGILLAVVGIKYQGSTGTTLFRQHSRAFALFAIDICVYDIALVTAHLRVTDRGGDNNIDQTPIKPVFLVSGAVACELLLFVFVDSKIFSWLSINALFLSIAACLCDVKGRFHGQNSEERIIDCPNNDGTVCTSIKLASNGTSCEDSGSDLRTRRRWFIQAFAIISSCGRRTMEDDDGSTASTTSTGHLEILSSNV